MQIPFIISFLQFVVIKRNFGVFFFLILNIVLMFCLRLNSPSTSVISFEVLGHQLHFSQVNFLLFFCAVLLFFFFEVFSCSYLIVSLNFPTIVAGS